MYELKIKLDFSAAHNLRGYQGECESLHGHNWFVEVYVKSAVLNDIGLVIDFKELKSATNEILDRLDHKYLNSIEYFGDLEGGVNPSSENIARYIYEELDSKLKESDAKVTKVVVFESANSSAAYYKEV